MSKRKRKGRSIDHVWRFAKYKVDNAVYAKCSCGFHYPCYVNEKGFMFKTIPDPLQLYLYCPQCGAKKKEYISEVTIVDKYPWE